VINGNDRSNFSRCDRNYIELKRIADARPSLPPHIQESITALLDAVFHLEYLRPLNVSPSVHLAHLFEDNFSKNDRDQLSRTILKALRHTPELLGLQMNSDGWVDATRLLVIVGQQLGFGEKFQVADLVGFLEEIGLAERVQVEGDRVRANYGHSTKQFEPSTSAIPDQPLFHRTSANNWAMIECFGLSPFKRRFVQLTTDFDYASQIAKSHGRSPMVLQVATAHAIESDVKFYPTDTRVWQASTIPPICLQVWMDDTFELEDPLF